MNGGFELLKGGMPPAPIADGFGKTLAELKLINARIIQKGL
jgi:hypothetical protein